MPDPDRQPTDLGSALIASLRDPASSSALVSLGDAALGAAAFGGALAGVPIVSALRGAYGGVVAARDTLLLRKLAAFARGARNVSPEARAQFTHEHLATAEQRRRVGDRLLLEIDRFERQEKADILGQVVRLWMLGDIDESVRDRLAHALHVASVPDLYALAGGQEPDPATCERLFAAGLASLHGLRHIEGSLRHLSADGHRLPTTPPDFGKPDYHLNELGALMQAAIELHLRDRDENSR